MAFRRVLGRRQVSGRRAGGRTRMGCCSTALHTCMFKASALSIAVRCIPCAPQSAYGPVLAALDAQLAAPRFRHLPRQLAHVVSRSAHASLEQLAC